MMDMGDTTPLAVSVRDAADMLSLSTPTVRKMIDGGQLDAIRLGPKSVRITVASIRRLHPDLDAALNPNHRTEVVAGGDFA